MINQITYPTKYSEFEVQSELFEQLKSKGYRVRGCVPSRCTEAKVYFDIVVFNALKQPVAIIECKNHEIPVKKTLGSRQGRRYAMFGVPILICLNWSEIELTIKKVEEICQDATFA